MTIRLQGLMISQDTTGASLFLSKVCNENQTLFLGWKCTLNIYVLSLVHIVKSDSEKFQFGDYLLFLHNI